MKIFAISDIHGAYNAMIELFNKAKINFKKDHLFILGDMIDWGHQNLNVLKYLMELHQEYPNNIHPILGNHELLMISARADNLNINANACWKDNRGGITEEELFTRENRVLSRRILDWLKSLPTQESFGPYIFAHSIVNTSPESYGKLDSFIWKSLHPEFGFDDILKVWERADIFIDQGKDGKILVAGHTTACHFTKSEKNEVYFNFDKHYINIDCGAKGIDYYESGQDDYKLALIRLPDSLSTNENDYQIWYSTKKSNF